MHKHEILQWQKLLSCKRVNDIKKGKTETPCDDDPRNPFQRDCDRITYSYPFRRLQDKTQVIPLPVIDFVHTRLTHSLEVATVGRSLGKMLESFLLKREVIEQTDCGNISAILAAACLAHDIGNPPFGHSGEDSISEYFKHGDNNPALIDFYKIYRMNSTNSFSDDFMQIKSIEKECKYRDLTIFEGNAMGFKLLTKNDDIGLNLTCATLAAFTKYPRQSFIAGEEKNSERWSPRVSQKKYGFFQTELEDFQIVAEEVGLKKLQEEGGNHSWARHPLSFLMEAADDICYRIIDLEDGYRVGRIPFEEAEKCLIIIAQKDKYFDNDEYVNLRKDKFKFTYLRGCAINLLIKEAFQVFLDHYEAILSFDFDQDLIKSIKDDEITKSLTQMKAIIKKHIYLCQDVLSVEAAGFEVLGGLLDNYINASNICLDCPEELRSKKAAKIFDLLPEEYKHGTDEELYLRYLKIAGYVSGMTDTFAINLFQKTRGIKT